jgi:hypothetical protein
LYIQPLTRNQYIALTRERAADGFGPFCGSYENYLSVCAAHNAAVLAA